jgi:Protein of unknown function (DUF3631)
MNSTTKYESGVDDAVIRHFVSLARPLGGQLMLLHISDQGSPPQARTFLVPAETIALIEWARHHNAEHRNIYWLPNDTALTGKKPAKNNMTEARYAWVDCDPDIDGFGSYDAARAHLTGVHFNKLAPIASFVIDSGNGLQAFFRLPEPVSLPDGLESYERANKAIGQALQGPSTFSCDHIMRVPGTLNWPNAAKLKKGYPAAPRMSRILSETDRAYTIEELVKLAAEHDKPTDDTAPEHDALAGVDAETGEVDALRRFFDLLKTDVSLRRRWEGDTTGLTDTTGSGMDMSMYALLAVRRFGHEEIAAIMADWSHGGTGRTQGLRYWDRMRANTRAAPESVTEGESDTEAVRRLAALKRMDYDRVRQEASRRLGVQISTLDKLVVAARADAASDALGPCRDVEPCADAVDGAALLDEISSTVQRFIVCEPATAHAAALWVTMTWLMDSVDIAPIVVITAPEKRCGKSLMLSLMGRLSRRSLAASNITPAALFRAIEAWQPTLMIDEADAFMRENEELRGLLNCGHTRDSAYVVRTVGDDHTPKQFFVWGAKAIAGIGHLADTLMDRAITLELRRKLPHEKVDKLRHAETNLFDTLCSKLARWAYDNAEAVRSARPAFPDVLHDRAADNWEPLLQIANVAGGTWPALAARTAITVSGSVEPSQSAGAVLLTDIQEVFEAEHKARLFSVDLLAGLCRDEEKPWGTWNRGRPMTPRQLAKKLEGYGIKSAQIRIGYETKKGYRLDLFADVFTRYLSPPAVATLGEEIAGTASVGRGDLFGLM